MTAITNIAMKLVQLTHKTKGKHGFMKNIINHRQYDDKLILLYVLFYP